MSIVKALNELSGKEANTIEKAIRNIELGGGGGVFIVTSHAWEEDPSRQALNSTWKEINDAFMDGKIVFYKKDEGSDTLISLFFYPLTEMQSSDSPTYQMYRVGFHGPEFNSETKDGELIEEKLI